MIRERLIPLLVVLGCAGCDADRPAAPATSVASAPTATSVSSRGDEPPAGPPRVRYDLRAHLARAELRHGGALVMDHGVPGGAKYTLGGYRTRVGGDHVLDGATVAVIPGVTGHVLVPVDAPGPHRLVLRARAFRDGQATLYVGGETLAHVRLPTDGSFAEVAVELPEGRLAPGDRAVQLRVPAAGSAPGIGSAGVAIDWVSLGPPAVTPPPPPRPEELVQGDALALGDGWALGYALEVPTGARLRARGTGAEGSRLTVVAHRDGAPPLELGAFALGASPVAIDLELGRVGGETVRLDLVARGAVRLADPTVVTLDAPPLATAPPRAPRNVLVYLIDTLRADKLAPWNPGTRVRTPGLARYVRDAAVFARGQAQENWTKPSVATLLSGLLPWEHTATGSESVVPSSVDLLSERLQARGFFTGCFIANGYVSNTFGFAQGWNTYRNYIREGRRTQARFVAADVLDWLDARPAERPFFLYVHTIDPHVPYLPPADILATYDAEPYEGPVDFGRDRELLEKIKIGRVTLNDRDKRRLEALYDGEITYHDLHFASILDGLASRGLAEDTMVIITADHGEELFDHASVGHGHSLYQELLHVPLVVRWPGLEGGAARIEDAVGLVDVVPTVLDALGHPLPEGLSGRSLVPLLRGEAARAPRAAVAGFMDGHRAITVGRWKLIQRTESDGKLFDLAEDPGETRDLAAERPLVLRYLRGLLGLALRGEEGPAPTHAAEAATIDAELDAQLRALGYVGASRPPARGASDGGVGR